MVVLLYIALSSLAGLIVLFLIWVFLLADSDFTTAIAEKYGTQISAYSGKVVWITGASTGLGESMAYELATVGTKLILTARSEDLLHKVKDECIKRSGGKLSKEDILVLPFDLANLECHKEKAEKVVEHFGRIDILINNAGRYQVGEITETDISAVKAIFDVNFFGTISITKQVIKQFMKQNHGHIILISSIAGKYGIPSVAPYCSTKHALIGYFDTLRMELRPYGVTVTTIIPGIFSSSIFGKTITTEANKMLEKEYNHYECVNMTSERCAHLSLIAGINKLYESWVAFQPFVLMCWAAQYTPNIFKYIMSLLYTKRRLGELYAGKWPYDLPVWKPLIEKECIIR